MSAPAARRRFLKAKHAENGRHLVLYDGVCGLCDRSVQFLLAHDLDGVLFFAPLQGETASTALDDNGLPNDLKTMVLVENHGSAAERVYVRSTAALRMLDLIGGGWRIASWLWIVPRPIRDAVYRWIARNRYDWFGKFDACKLPPPEVKARFLD